MENFGQELKAQLKGDHCHNLEDVGSNRVTKKKMVGGPKIEVDCHSIRDKLDKRSSLLYMCLQTCSFFFLVIMVKSLFQPKDIQRPKLPQGVEANTTKRQIKKTRLQ